MPVIKGAKKALRQSKKRTILNKGKISSLRVLLSKFKKQKDEKILSSIYSLVDKMVKNKIIHKNKAARIKGKLVKKLSKNTVKKSVEIKKTKKKTTSKK